MKTQEFELIKQTWETLAEQAHSHYDNILSKEDLNNLKVCELAELVKFSKEFIINMEALFCDLRHILGMGQLKANEQCKLVSIFKDITHFRSDAKRISQITSFNDVAYIPAQSKYELKLNPGIKLVSQLRPGQVDGVIIEESKNGNKINVVLLKDGRIEVSFDETEIREFRKLFNLATNGPAQISNKLLEHTRNRLDSGSFGGFAVRRESNKYILMMTNTQGVKAIFEFFKDKIK